MTKPTKITVVSTSFREYDRRIQRIIGAFESFGYTTQWFARNAHNDPDAIVTRFKSGVLFYLEYNIRLCLRLLRSNTDVIYAVDFDTLLASRVAALLKRSTLVFDAHEYFTEVPELENKPLKKWIWKQVGKLCLNAKTPAITVNQSLAKILGEEYACKFDVIRNIPARVELAPEESSDDSERILLYQGAINVGRGIEIACEAIDQLPEQYELWIIGDGDILEQLRSKYQVNPRITFIGWVAPEDLPGYTQEAWLGLNMLESSSLNYYYSLTNKYFDYIHANLPAIHMAFPQYKLLQEQFPVAYLAHDYSVQELVAGVKYYESEELYTKSVESCRVAKESFDWSQEQDHLKALVEQWFT